MYFFCKDRIKDYAIDSWGNRYDCPNCAGDLWLVG